MSAPNTTTPRRRCLGIIRTSALLASVLALAGCDLLDDPPPKEPPVVAVVDEITTLKVGDSVSWKLSPGQYHLQMTADNDGAAVTWLGGVCENSKPTRIFVTDCKMAMTGQLKIANPSGFLGMGSGTTVTVKVLRMNSAASESAQ